MLLWLLPLANATVPPPIVGGSAAPDGRWGETAALFEGADVGCTGVLVSPSWVLTAGHCTSSAVTSVYLGGNDLGDLAEGELIEVVQAIPYPEYWDTWDVGLLELERPAETPPPEVAVGCALDELADGVEAQIIGYGAVDEYGTRYSDHLMEARVPITDADCGDTSLGCEEAVSPGGELAAGGPEGDTCYGDSGGPLMLWTSYGVPALLGITSRGVDAEGPPCATGGIYGRVDAVAAWVANMTREPLTRPSCAPVGNQPPSPTAETLVVAAGASVAVQIDPGDPDPYDDHTYTLLESPLHGTVVLNSTGLVTYTADAGAHGYDALVVRVDDGELSAELTLEANITGGDTGTGDDDTGGEDPGEPGGCGCASAPGGHAAWWAVLVYAWGRRARTGSRAWTAASPDEATPRKSSLRSAPESASQ